MGDFIQAYCIELKDKCIRIVKNPLYIGLFILFLFSGGSSVYILFASQNALPSLPTFDQISPAVVLSSPSPSPIVLVVASPSATSILSATSFPSPTPKDPLSGWNTYTNTTYKYSIKYPAGWVATDTISTDPLIPSYIIFGPTASASSSGKITISYTTRTTDQLAAIYGVAAQAMTVDNINAAEYQQTDSDGNKSVSVIIPFNTNALIFYSENQYQDILMEMLGTVQLSS